jgi:hypothetical protein
VATEHREVTRDGLPRSAFAYSPTDDPGTWVLPYAGPDGIPDPDLLAASASALAETDIIPQEYAPVVRAKLRQGFRRVGHEVPGALREEGALLEEALDVFVEKSGDDHFYGPWRGGPRSAGGGPASEKGRGTAAERRAEMADRVGAENVGNLANLPKKDQPKSYRDSKTALDEAKELKHGLSNDELDARMEALIAQDDAMKARTKELEASGAIPKGPPPKGQPDPVRDPASKYAGTAYEPYAGLTSASDAAKQRPAPMSPEMKGLFPYADRPPVGFKRMEGIKSETQAQYEKRKGPIPVTARGRHSLPGVMRDVRQEVGAGDDINSIAPAFRPPSGTLSPTWNAADATASNFVSLDKGLPAYRKQNPVREASSDEHFYGAWRGGARSAGGGPASEKGKGTKEQRRAEMADRVGAENVGNLANLPSHADIQGRPGVGPRQQGYSTITPGIPGDATPEFRSAMASRADRWVPGAGGKEQAYTNRHGARVQRVFNPKSGEHGWHDLGSDIVYSDRDPNTPRWLKESRGASEREADTLRESERLALRTARARAAAISRHTPRSR